MLGSLVSFWQQFGCLVCDKCFAKHCIRRTLYLLLLISTFVNTHFKCCPLALHVGWFTRHLDLEVGKSRNQTQPTMPCSRWFNQPRPPILWCLVKPLRWVSRVLKIHGAGDSGVMGSQNRGLKSPRRYATQWRKSLTWTEGDACRSGRARLSPSEAEAICTGVTWITIYVIWKDMMHNTLL